MSLEQALKCAGARKGKRVENILIVNFHETKNFPRTLAQTSLHLPAHHQLITHAVEFYHLITVFRRRAPALPAAVRGTSNRSPQSSLMTSPVEPSATGSAGPIEWR